MVMVYAARVKNKITQMMEIAAHKGTDVWTKSIQGEKIEGSGEEVDSRLVDSNGRYSPKEHN